MSQIKSGETAVTLLQALATALWKYGKTFFGLVVLAAVGVIVLLSVFFSQTKVVGSSFGPTRESLPEESNQPNNPRVLYYYLVSSQEQAERERLIATGASEFYGAGRPDTPVTYLVAETPEEADRLKAQLADTAAKGGSAYRIIDLRP